VALSNQMLYASIGTAYSFAAFVFSIMVRN
jgi:hypothetical protein